MLFTRWRKLGCGSVGVGLATGTPVLPVMPKVVTFHSRKASATAAAVET